MNSKIQKLKDDNAKDKDKIARLQARIRERDKQIQELENTEIIGVVREHNLTPEQLAALIAQIQTGTAPKKEEPIEAP